YYAHEGVICVICASGRSSRPSIEQPEREREHAPQPESPPGAQGQSTNLHGHLLSFPTHVATHPSWVCSGLQLFCCLSAMLPIYCLAAILSSHARALTSTRLRRPGASTRAQRRRYSSRAARRLGSATTKCLWRSSLHSAPTARVRLPEGEHRG